MPAPISQRTLVLGFFYAALAAALWSLITPFSRMLFELHTSPLETAFWRSLFGGICFVIYSLIKGCLKVPFRDGLRMLFFGGLLGALMFGAFQLSIEMSGGATAVVLLYTAPAWVAVLSRVLFHDAISRTKLLAIAIALAGVVLVSLSLFLGRHTLRPCLGLWLRGLLSLHLLLCAKIQGPDHLFLRLPWQRPCPFALHLPPGSGKERRGLGTARTHERLDKLFGLHLPGPEPQMHHPGAVRSGGQHRAGARHPLGLALL